MSTKIFSCSAWNPYNYKNQSTVGIGLNSMPLTDSKNLIDARTKGLFTSIDGTAGVLCANSTDYPNPTQGGNMYGSAIATNYNGFWRSALITGLYGISRPALDVLLFSGSNIGFEVHYTYSSVSSYGLRFNMGSTMFVIAAGTLTVGGASQIWTASTLPSVSNGQPNAIKLQVFLDDTNHLRIKLSMTNSIGTGFAYWTSSGTYSLGDLINFTPYFIVDQVNYFNLYSYQSSDRTSLQANFTSNNFLSVDYPLMNFNFSNEGGTSWLDSDGLQTNKHAYLLDGNLGSYSYNPDDSNEIGFSSSQNIGLIAGGFYDLTTGILIALPTTGTVKAVQRTFHRVTAGSSGIFHVKSYNGSTLKTDKSLNVPASLTGNTLLAEFDSNDIANAGWSTSTPYKIMMNNP